jgi:hypothetical protein
MWPEIARLLLAGLVVASGYCCRYDAGEMRRVAAVRGLDLAGAGCKGAVALRDPRWLGKKVYLQWHTGRVDGPYLVVDHLNSAHTPYGADRWAVDVDYATWQRVVPGRVGPLPGVTVILPPWAAGWSGVAE